MRTTTMALVICALVATACGSGSDDGGMCEPLDGAYDVTFTEVSGDCGFGEVEQVIVYGDAAQAPSADCTGGQSVSDDGCVATLDQTCAIYDEITGDFVGDSNQKGSLEASGDGFSGKLQWHIVFADGSSCSSIVEVLGRQQ